MNIHGIDWVAGKKYRDEDGVIWKVVGSQNTLVNSKNDLPLEDSKCIRDILKMNFEQVEEKKYYLRFAKPYIEEHVNFLNLIESTGLFMLATRYPDLGFATQFTESEIYDFVTNRRIDIDDFEKIGVKQYEDNRN